MGREGQHLSRTWGLPVGKNKRRPWQAAALAASILSSCFLLTQAKKRVISNIPITLSPLNPVSGQRVVFALGELVRRKSICEWYRGSSDKENKILEYDFGLTQSSFSAIHNTLKGIDSYIKGDAHTGREKVSSNCSLYLDQLLLSDTGTYTVEMKRSGQVKQRGRVFLEVSDVPPDLGAILPDSPKDDGDYDYLPTPSSMLVPALDIQDPSHLKLPLEIIWRIIIGSLAVTTVLEFLLYFLLRSCYWRNRNSNRIISATPGCGMIPSSAKMLNQHGDPAVQSKL
ncbi:uncharacterized protein LOC128332879 [Hemicordylus capensis]|uniref:uncharacterized protein LOC128332879 n=1 Tax=Hemicordylus capensis TaxID=884348 RepID=UPI0023025FDC|nr:uncharacterized protein LOC128332879 [Hemicordylus capensis]